MQKEDGSNKKDRRGKKAAETQGSDADGHEETPSIKVTDRRHWARDDRGGEEDDGASFSTQPTIVDEYRERAQAAERKLQEYIAAFKQAQADQEAFRARLGGDLERRVALKFGEIVVDLLETVDDLDLALSHVEGVPEAEPLARGVTLARDRFLAVLERHGVEKIVVDGMEFDPNVAEALRVDPVDDPALDGKVTVTLRPGYRLDERILRAARVAVGKLDS